MSIAGGCQSKVLSRVGSIVSLLHATQQHPVNDKRLVWIAYLVQHRAQVGRFYSATLETEADIKRSEKLLKLLHGIKLRFVMQTIYSCYLCLLQIIGHTFVGKQHTLFDDSMRLKAFAARDRGHLPRRFIQPNKGLGQIKIQRPSGIAPAIKSAG